MKVAIIGSGLMATGITQVMAISDAITDVVVITRSEDKSVSVNKSCLKHFSRLLRKDKITEEQAGTFPGKITYSNVISSVEGADLIIEAVAENSEIKGNIFSSLARYVSDKTIIASNTSSLSITEFSSYFANPENVVGLHFFNPAPVMELVEVVAGHVTSSEVIEQLVSLTEQLGKSPVVVNEAPGFVVNRMLIPMINEAVSILAEGVASATDIDKAMKFGAHHPMGPLALADLIGNDVNLSIMETLYKETGDPKYRAHPLLRKMVRANHLGRKTKKGFFEY